MWSINDWRYWVLWFVLVLIFSLVASIISSALVDGFWTLVDAWTERKSDD